MKCDFICPRQADMDKHFKSCHNSLGWLVRTLAIYTDKYVFKTEKLTSKKVGILIIHITLFNSKSNLGNFVNFLPTTIIIIEKLLKYKNI